jgi:hypothetical protein
MTTLTFPPPLEIAIEEQHDDASDASAAGSVDVVRLEPFFQAVASDHAIATLPDTENDIVVVSASAGAVVAVHELVASPSSVAAPASSSSRSYRSVVTGIADSPATPPPPSPPPVRQGHPSPRRAAAVDVSSLLRSGAATYATVALRGVRQRH